uniref:CN hydrolase domain-containing protein n=1 Tax=Auxenochlorella protothecoides TaxID=3075 RepID=A0A1D2ADS7_AUXPR
MSKLRSLLKSMPHLIHTGFACGISAAAPGLAKTPQRASTGPIGPLSSPLRTMATAVNATTDRIAPPTPSKSKFKLALCQLAVGADKERNIQHARQVIDRAAGEGARLVILPEIWNSPYSNDSFPVYAEEVGGGESPSTAMLSDAAAANSIVLVGGSIPERSEGKLFNTSFVYGPKGELLGRHRKVHLFDIDIPGKIRFKESEVLTPGSDLTVIDTELGRIGVAICYDIRFPELAALYAARGCQLLVYPGAFNMTTGPAHWELLLRARAVDAQLYVAGVAPARDLSAGYHSWGHSALVDPFGRVVAAAEESEAIIHAEVDLDQIAEQRKGVPYNDQKRSDLYSLLDLTR